MMGNSQLITTLSFFRPFINVDSESIFKRLYFKKSLILKVLS